MSEPQQFTQRARQVLSLAQEEAQHLKHNVIAPEHVLIGILRDEENVAADVLRGFGLQVEELRSLIQHQYATQENSTALPDLLPRTKRLLELSVDEAHRRGHQFIGTEHLLLGMLRQSDDKERVVLQRFNIKPDEVQKTIDRLLGSQPAPELKPMPRNPNAPLPPNRFIRFINRIFRINL